jgi:L-alanine-DL-glutamate epimerase-like enolase superfamily enzyme
MATPVLAFAPYFDLTGNPLARKVKITDVKCVLTKIGFRVSPLVKITTDAGLVGIGECHHDENGYGAKDIIHNVCKPILMGQDPLDLEYLVFKMSTRTSYYGGNHGVATHAVYRSGSLRCGILSARSQSKPVHKILGGGRHVSEVRAYASAGPKDMLDKASCAEFAALMKGQGWTACKTNILRDQEWNKLDNRRLSNLEADRNAQGFANMREALGDGVRHRGALPTGSLIFDSALRLANAVAPIRPFWMEDPLPIAYNEQWVKLTEKSPVPVLTGENLYTRDDFRPFIVNQGVNLIEIDVSMSGGLLEAKKIADLAELYYIPVCTHNVAGPVATIASANFAASVREFVAHEAFISNPINRAGKGINGDPDVLGYDKDVIKNGHIQLSDRPGFGIELNEKLIKEKYLVEGETWWN